MLHRVARVGFEVSVGLGDIQAGGQLGVALRNLLSLLGVDPPHELAPEAVGILQHHLCFTDTPIPCTA